MRPSTLLIKYIAFWLCTVVVLASWRALDTSNFPNVLLLIWYVGFALFTLVALQDYFQPSHFQSLNIKRILPSALAVGTNNTIHIDIKNTGRRAILFQATELVDSSVVLQQLPFEGQIDSLKHTRIEASIRPTIRGLIAFGGIEALIQSPKRLWEYKKRFGKTEHVRVYPNFTAVSHFELFAHSNEMSQLGIHMNQRRGEGLDFHQLREFRAGDQLRQVDWKASARTLKPISREFQDERDQDIIFLIDNGRRMRSKDGELSHFDHCLNAVLLCSFVALRQGDAAGLMSFGSEQRWQSPLKGKNNFNLFMQRVFDLHSSTAASDYTKAAADLLKKQKKRALIIMLSNVDSQDNSELIAAYELLRKQHLVMFACLKESSIDALIDEPVVNFTDALTYSSALEFNVNRQRSLQQLSSAGAIVIDEQPRHLHIALVNKYLELKRSGRL